MSPKRLVESYVKAHSAPGCYDRDLFVLSRITRDEPYDWEGELTLRERALREIEQSVGHELNRAKLIEAARELMREMIAKIPIGSARLYTHLYAECGYSAEPVEPQHKGPFQPGLFGGPKQGRL